MKVFSVLKKAWCSHMVYSLFKTTGMYNNDGCVCGVCVCVCGVCVCVWCVCVCVCVVCVLCVCVCVCVVCVWVCFWCPRSLPPSPFAFCLPRLPRPALLRFFSPVFPPSSRSLLLHSQMFRQPPCSTDFRFSRCPGIGKQELRFMNYYWWIMDIRRSVFIRLRLGFIYIYIKEISFYILCHLKHIIFRVLRACYFTLNMNGIVTCFKWSYGFV